MLKVDVKKKYPSFELKAQFTINPRSYSILLGPSGAGKSLTLRLIAGFELPDQGKIIYNEKDLTPLPPEDRPVVYLPQSLGLFPHMTVRQNLEYPFRCKRKQPNNFFIKDIVKEFGLEKLIDKKPRVLSGGEKQRVALARAILSTPEIFLLDEPLSSLDFDLKVKLVKFLKKIHEKFKLTILHVTYDPFEAISLGEKILVIEKGKIRAPQDSKTLKEFFNLMNNLEKYMESR
ncbi:ABC transporter related protein [Thermodesulfatator indicus DSM 15286]|uniref:ABC transporter related protein n=1 Tax=Thermodesulfatator indicus (strain DSM 15286 / JCM 11887 / CIR29812) TaxID=667014 RepID=F8AB50_THEID|nr:ABC transporter ATP-binding protein [Thermodesulfatator indicus]AEH45506.1 ABC transporter related protein [Thermodesulfatator indicus DSM 15286]